MKSGSNIKNFFLMTISVMIMVAGIYFFKYPNNFSFGGVTGVAVIVSRVTGGFLSRGNVVMVLNMVLLIVGFAVFGKKFGLRTAYCSTLMSVALQVMEYVFPLDGPLTDQPLLELCYAVALPAVGTAVLFNMEATTGGTDIVAMLLRKFTEIDIGKALMLSDLVLTLVVFLVYDIKTGLLSFLGLMAKSLVIDNVIESINLCKYCNVICQDPVPIENFIKYDLNRSATLCGVKGAYSGQERTMILTIVTRGQAVRLKKFIREKEPAAFVIVTNTSEIIGRGFRM